MSFDENNKTPWTDNYDDNYFTFNFNSFENDDNHNKLTQLQPYQRLPTFSICPSETAADNKANDDELLLMMQNLKIISSHQ